MVLMFPILIMSWHLSSGWSRFHLILGDIYLKEKKLSVPATEYRILGTKNNKKKVNLESVYQIISNSNAGYLLLWNMIFWDGN